MDVSGLRGSKAQKHDSIHDASYHCVFFCRGRSPHRCTRENCISPRSCDLKVGEGGRDHVLSCLAESDWNTRMESPDSPGAGRLTLLSMEAKTGPRPTGMGASFGPNRRSSEAEDDVNILRLLCSVALKSLPLIDPPYPYDYAHLNIVMISPRLPSLNEKDIQDGENSRSQHCSLICSSWPCPNGNRGGGTSCCQRLTSPAAPFATSC